MKKICLGLLSVLFGIMFGLGLVRGDIIDSDWREPREINQREMDDDSWVSPSSSERPLKLSLIPDGIGRSFQLFIRILFLVTIVLWGIFLIHSLFVHIYEKFIGKTKKYPIPSFKGMKKRLGVASILLVFCMIIGLWIMFVDPSRGVGGQTKSLKMGDTYRPVTYHPPVYKNNILGMVKLGKDIIYCISFLLFSFVVLVVYYRFFKKIGGEREE